MVLEVVAYGVFWVWLLGLLPAAIVTIAKGRLLLFATGLIGLGITWFIGAIPLAAPSSRWAQRFYGEERMARATDPVRHRRPPRATALWLGGGIALVLAVGLFAARPTPLTGLGGRALQSSVGGVLGPAAEACRHRSGDEWTCHAYDREVSSAAPYRVKMHRLGCWTATPARLAGEGLAERRSGCVTIWDEIRPLDDVL